MKILVLMPLDEKWSIGSAAIWEKLDAETKKITFAMPYFMDWAVQTKKSDNWIVALFDALISAKVEYNNNEDVIILGNCDCGLKFDAIFNFQDPDEELPYEDKNIEKVRDLVKGEEMLTNMLNLHKAEDSTFTLKNYQATADFLSAYAKTDPHLNEIRAKYKDRIEGLKEVSSLNETTKSKNSGGNA